MPSFRLLFPLSLCPNPSRTASHYLLIPGKVSEKRQRAPSRFPIRLALSCFTLVFLHIEKMLMEESGALDTEPYLAYVKSIILSVPRG